MNEDTVMEAQELRVDVNGPVQNVSSVHAEFLDELHAEFNGKPTLLQRAILYFRNIDYDTPNKVFMAEMLDSTSVSAVMTLWTLWALYAEDFKVWLVDPSQDQIFAIAALIAYDLFCSFDRKL